jgi:lipopolysaccharide/colanic/teichoic acid biosynthesis glycosyltransferase
MNAPARIPYDLASQGRDELLIAPSLERRRLQCHLVQIVADIAAVVIGFALFGYIYIGPEGLSRALLGSQLLLPVFLTVALYNGAYSIGSLRSVAMGIARAELALAMSAAAVLLFAFLTKTSAELSRANYTGGLLLSGFMLAWTRMQMRAFVAWRCGANVTNELIVDDGGPHVALPGSIRIAASEFNLKPDLNDPHALARFGLVLRNMDRVIVSCPPERRARWAMMLKGANVAGEVLDEEVVALGAHGARVVQGHGLLMVSSGPLGLRARAVKRLFDLGITVSALILLAPLLLLVALAIKLEDGGPVLFVQRRMGRGNRFFNIYKFRSMSVAQADGDGTVSASKNDQRITRVGRFIRRTSIDELPQLFNVLIGDMSLVGPRPHAIGSQAGDKLFWEVDLRYWQRHSLKPGLSGLAQVRGFRGATDREDDLVDRLHSDLEYMEGWSILRDVKILVMTVGVLVHDRAF